MDNISWSIQTGLWVAMDKVGERMMRLWDAKPNAHDKIYLLFSVNGQKSYCGLAEMRGPWSVGGANCEGFQFNVEGRSKQYG